MHRITSKNNCLFTNILSKKYGENDVKKILRGNYVFNYANPCIKNPCIANTMAGMYQLYIAYLLMHPTNNPLLANDERPESTRGTEEGLRTTSKDKMIINIMT